MEQTSLAQRHEHDLRLVCVEKVLKLSEPKQ